MKNAIKITILSLLASSFAVAHAEYVTLKIDNLSQQQLKRLYTAPDINNEAWYIKPADFLDPDQQTIAGIVSYAFYSHDYAISYGTDNNNYCKLDFHLAEYPDGLTRSTVTCKGDLTAGKPAHTDAFHNDWTIYRLA